MTYNVHAQEHNYFRTRTRTRFSPNQNKSITATSDRMSDEDYSALTNCHHDDERYTDHTPAPRYKRHTNNYLNRFRINPDQTFITIRKSANQYTLDVSGDIPSDLEQELIDRASTLPIGLTMTLKEVLDKIS